MALVFPTSSWKVWEFRRTCSQVWSWVLQQSGMMAWVFWAYSWLHCYRLPLFQAIPQREMRSCKFLPLNQPEISIRESWFNQCRSGQSRKSRSHWCLQCGRSHIDSVEPWTRCPGLSWARYAKFSNILPACWRTPLPLRIEQTLVLHSTRIEPSFRTPKHCTYILLERSVRAITSVSLLH